MSLWGIKGRENHDRTTAVQFPAIMSGNRILPGLMKTPISAPVAAAVVFRRRRRGDVAGARRAGAGHMGDAWDMQRGAVFGPDDRNTSV